jgi:putative DNA primase/helicase
VRARLAGKAAPAPTAPTLGSGDAIKRAQAWLAKVPGAIQGQNGSGATYAAACGLVHGFALSESDALALLLADYNPRCEPTWTERELRHKVEDAARKQHDQPRGYLLERGQLPADVRAATAPRPSPPAAGTVGQRDADAHEHDDDPYRIARDILAGYRHGDVPNARLLARRVLRVGRVAVGAGDRATWEATVNADTRAYFERPKGEPGAGGPRRADDIPRMGKVTRGLVSNVIASLEAQTLIRGVESAPAWIQGETGPTLPSWCRPVTASSTFPPLWPAGPTRFAADAGPVQPQRGRVRRADRRAGPGRLARLPVVTVGGRSGVYRPVARVVRLSAHAGHVLQKMLLMIGPRRSGKGTISRVLQALVGPANCCGPTLSGLAGPFGLAPLLGKSVAVVEDARLSARADAAVVAERLLAISGEGTLTVERKHMEGVDTRLRTRFVVSSNEIPRITDISGALVSRWSVSSIRPLVRGDERIRR